MQCNLYNVDPTDLLVFIRMSTPFGGGAIYLANQSSSLKTYEFSIPYRPLFLLCFFSQLQHLPRASVAQKSVDFQNISVLMTS